MASYETVLDDTENKLQVRITFTYQELNELPSLDHLASHDFCEYLIATTAYGPRSFKVVVPSTIFAILTHIVALTLGAFIHALVHAH